MKNVLLGLLSLLVVAGCAGKDQAEAAMQIEDMEWQLEVFEAAGVKAEPAVGEVTLRLDSAEQRASGTAGCNRFSGGYALDGATLSFTPMAMTKRMCGDPSVMEQEFKYANWLSSMGDVSVRDGKLRLTTESGETLVFRAL